MKVLVARVKGFRLVVDKSRCTLCLKCVELCPAEVFVKDGDSIAARSDRCIGCYGCVPLCPVKAISVEAEVESMDYEELKALTDA